MKIMWVALLESLKEWDLQDSVLDVQHAQSAHSIREIS